MNRVQYTNAVFREVGIMADRIDMILKKNLPPELPPAQFNLLNHLSYTTNKDETASDIAHNSHVSLSAMSQIIKQLSNKGYVALTNRSQDARKKTITITDAGAAAYEQALSGVSIDIKTLASKFSLSDMQTLFELSHKFRIAFEQTT